MNAHALAPLWNVSIVVVSVTYGVLHTLASLFGLYGLALRAVLWFSAWRLAYKILTAVAQGHRDLPTLDFAALNPFAEIRLVTHFLVFPVAIGVLVGYDSVPELVGWPAAVALAAVIPASATVMALSDNFALALSPWHVAQLIGRLGLDYARLLVLCVACVLAAGIVRALPWPALLGPILANTADVWAALGVFALTGALIRERRAEFAIDGEVETAEERAERERRREWQTKLDGAYASLRSGLAASGRAQIEDLLESAGRTLAVYGWVFDATLRWETQATALWVGRQYVERLVAAGALHDALDVAAKCRRLSQGFEVAPGTARALCAYARSIGREALADELER